MRKMVVACACALLYVSDGIARAEEDPAPEAQVNAQRAVHAAPAVDPAEERADAWKEALEESLGLTPEEVSAYKSGKTALEAAGKPRETPAVAESAAVTVSMQPGAVSPKVTLLHGFVTAIEILDATGQPWPVVSVTQGDPNAVDVKVQGAAQSFTRSASQPSSTSTFGVVVPVAAADESAANVTAPASMPSSAGNVITVNPLTKFSATNIVVVLVGASRPISLLLTPIEATPSTPLQDRITLLVDGEGPNARIEPVRSYADLDAGPDLRNVLVGQPPTASAVEIIAELPSGVRAWRDGGVLWVRTPDRVISPAPMAHVAMGNMRAYRMTYLPVIVVAKGGRTEQFSVSN